MILKDYLIKKDKNFFKNFKSLLFYGENEGLKKDFNQVFDNPNSSKADIVGIIKKYVPNFIHDETGKNLDQKM